MTVAKKGPSNEKKWFEEFFLLLQPEKPYTTGEIIRFWIECESIPNDQKEKIRTTKNSVQTSLGKYISKRYEYEKRRAETNGTLEYAMVYEPIGRTLFQPTNFKQKIYLGAQYAWVAANHLGLEQPRSLDEVLRLRRVAMDEEMPEPENISKCSGVAVGNPDEVAQPAGTSSATVEASVESSLAVDAFNENQGEASLIEQVPAKKRSLRKRFRKWRVPMAFAMSAMSLVICVGVVGGSLLYKPNPELKQLEKANNEGGLRAIRRLAKLKPKTQTLGDLVTKAWVEVHEPKTSIEDILILVEPFFKNSKPGWQAKGHYLSGVAFLLRGKIHESLESFSEAEECLVGTQNQKNDLRDTYLGLAECYFLLGDSNSMLESIKKAMLLETKRYKSKAHHHMSKYWLLEGKIDNAIKESLKSIQLSTIDNDKTYLATYLTHHALLMISKGKLNKGYTLLKKAQLLAVDQENQVLLEYVFSYEQLWAQQMNLPTLNIGQQNIRGTFPQNKYYIELIQSLALEAN